MSAGVANKLVHSIFEIWIMVSTYAVDLFETAVSVCSSALSDEIMNPIFG